MYMIPTKDYPGNIYYRNIHMLVQVLQVAYDEKVFNNGLAWLSRQCSYIIEWTEVTGWELTWPINIRGIKNLFSPRFQEVMEYG